MINEKEFSEWMCKCGMRPNTLKSYINVLNKVDIGKIDLKKDELGTIGLLNSFIAQFGGNTGSRLKMILKKYVIFLYERDVSSITGMREKELYRIKKNSIITNLEINEIQKRVQFKTVDDIANMFIPAKTVYDLIETTKSVQVKSLILMLYDTGCRVNELLDNFNCNITKDGISIPKEICKTKRPRFIEFLIPETYQFYKNYLSSRSEKKENVDVKNDKAFTMNYMRFYYELKKIAKNVGFRPQKMSLGVYSEISPHWFRHTRATHLADSWEVGRLQRRLGHTDPRTLNIYIEYIRNTRPESLEKYLERTEKRL